MAVHEVFRVEGLSKQYSTYRSNLHRFGGWFGLPVSPTKTHVALQGVSFGVVPGQCIGILGQNGAGKSTLLKLITGTIRPTTGAIQVSGRASAMLELGLGFNPEFTGRQNVYLAGGLMGLGRTELTELMPSIAGFAELGDFFEQPLRVYSSGMQARLAFAVATATRPDILIVDEVLSVGDSYFQHKSFARILDFKQRGTAVLFVSHNIGDILALCDRAILLDKGSVLKDGPPDEVTDYYNGLVAARENDKLAIQQTRTADGWSVSKSGNAKASGRRLRLLDCEDGSELSVVRVNQRVRVELHVETHDDLDTMVFGLMIRSRTGHVVWGSNTQHTDQVLSDIKRGSDVVYTAEWVCALGPGSYSITYALTASESHAAGCFEWADNPLVFDVVSGNVPYFVGSSYLDVSFAARIDLHDAA